MRVCVCFLKDCMNSSVVVETSIHLAHLHFTHCDHLENCYMSSKGSPAVNINLGQNSEATFRSAGSGWIKAWLQWITGRQTWWFVCIGWLDVSWRRTDNCWLIFFFRQQVSDLSGSKTLTAPQEKGEIGNRTNEQISLQHFYLSRNIKQYCGSLPHTICIHMIHHTATKRERERLNKTLFTYCILDMKNKEPRTILKLKRNVAASRVGVFSCKPASEFEERNRIRCRVVDF